MRRSSYKIKLSVQVNETLHVCRVNSGLQFKICFKTIQQLEHLELIFKVDPKLKTLSADRHLRQNSYQIKLLT